MNKAPCLWTSLVVWANEHMSEDLIHTFKDS